MSFAGESAVQRDEKWVKRAMKCGVSVNLFENVSKSGFEGEKIGVGSTTHRLARTERSNSIE